MNRSYNAVVRMPGELEKKTVLKDEKTFLAQRAVVIGQKPEIQFCFDNYHGNLYIFLTFSACIFAQVKNKANLEVCCQVVRILQV